MTLIDLRCSGSLAIEFQSPKPQLSVVLEHVGGKTRVTDRDEFGGVDLSGHGILSLVPPHVRISVGAENIRFLRHLVVHLDPCEFVPLSLSDASPAATSSFSDDDLMRICRLLEAECETGSNSQLLGDALSALLYNRLQTLDAARGPDLETRSYRGGLSPRSLRRVTNLLEDDISTTIALARLTEVAGLSVPHFQRAFKTSTGLSPRR